MNIRKISTTTEGDLVEFPRRANSSYDEETEAKEEFPRRAISSHDEETEANDVVEDEVLGEPGNEPSSSLSRSQAQLMHQEAVNTNMQGYVLSWNNLSVKRGQKVIIDNLNGITRPGKITAIMGK